MSSLPDFLVQIGAAASLSTTKLVFPQEGLEGNLNAIHQRIEVEIQSVYEERERLLQENWPEFDSQLNGGVALMKRIKAEEQEVTVLEHELEGPNAFLPPLLQQLGVHSALVKAHHQSRTHLELLEALSNLHSLITTLSSQVTTGALPLAVSALFIVRQNLEQISTGWIEETEVWKSLKRWAKEEDDRLEGALIGALEACFSFEKVEGGQGKLTIKEKVSAAPNGELLEIRIVLETLDRLLKSSKTVRKIDGHLARISTQLLKYFIVPFLKPSSNLEFNYHSSGIAHSVSLIPSTSRSSSPIPALEKFLTYFSTNSTLLNSTFSSIITLNLTPAIQSHIITSHLHPSLPLSIPGLDDYFNLLKLATSFESTYLVKARYLSFLPTGQEGNREEGNVIQEWIERVDSHWAKAMGDQALDSIRVAIASGSWIGELVEIEIEDPEEWEEQFVKPIPVQEESEEESEYEEYEEEEPISVVKPIRVPTPPLVQTFGKKKLKATKIATPTPTPEPTFIPPPEPTFIPPPPISAIKPPSLLQAPLIPTPKVKPSTNPILIPTSLVQSQPPPEEEEDDPWGLSVSPLNTSTLPSPAPSSPSKKRHSATLQPPTRTRTMSVVSSTGSEDPWGLEGELDIDLGEPEEILEVSEVEDIPEMPGAEDGWGFVEDSIGEMEQETEKLKVGIESNEEPLPMKGLELNAEEEEPAEEEEDDGWGFGEEEVAEEELIVRDSTPMTSTIPLPSTPALLSPQNEISLLPIVEPSSISLPITPSVSKDSNHEKKESLGRWGWEGDENTPVIVPSIVSPIIAPVQRQKKMIRVKKIKPKKEKPVVIIPPPIMVRKQRSVRKESMMISNRAKEIVKIAERILQIVDEISHPSFAHHSFSTSSHSLLKTFASLLSLYRAVAPVQFLYLIKKEAGKGMQFFNDTEWIQGQISNISIANNLTFSAGDVDRGVKRLGEMARVGKLTLIDSQRDRLMKTLDGARSFLYTSDVVRYRDTEKAIRTVVTELETLATVWKPVMSASSFYSTLGGLVNSVLYRVLNEIEDQVDISEEESIKLNILCKILHGLEGIFLDGEVSSVGREVPIWFKFVFLSELLEASMADILFLFDNCHLVDFTTFEIAKLVRALFSDSPLRQKNLEHIMKGHPDIVED